MQHTVGPSGQQAASRRRAGSAPSLASVRAAQSSYDRNVADVEAILLRERSWVFEIPQGEDVVALVSGGLDSVVMLDLVLDEWGCRVHPLYVRRGARAQRFEEQAFDWYVDLYRQRYGDRIADPIKLEVEVPPRSIKADIPRAFQRAVGLPMRNAVLQGYAVQAAVALNGRHGLSIRTVLSGSVAEDGRAPELGLLGLRVQTLSTCVHLASWAWQVASPMTEPTLRPRPLDKRDLIMRAQARDIPLDRTRSCFAASARPDGTCAACRKRRRAFAAARVSDGRAPTLARRRPA